MLRVYIILISLFHGVSLSASDKPKVVASASIFQDMAEHLGKDLVTVQSIVPIGGDPHIYEPTPSDAVLVASADIILVNGLTFEGWITELIENSGSKAQVILITEGVDAIMSEIYDNAADPHAWMDANNGKIYANNISKALQKYDPKNKSIYESNLDEYLTELSELDNYIAKAIKSIPEKKRVLITSHDAFAYYGKRYGILLSAIMGISTDAEAQTSDIVRVNKIIKESGISAVFIESTINPRLLEQLAKDNNIEIGGELYADSIGDKDSPAGGYIEMLRHNTDVIVNALSKNNMQKTKIDTDDKSKDWIIYSVIALLMVGSLVFLIFYMRK